MSPVERTIQFKILLTTEERADLQALADKSGLTATDYVRQTIRAAADAMRREQDAAAQEERSRDIYRRAVKGAMRAATSKPVVTESATKTKKGATK